MPKYQSLNGLRFVSILLVLLGHLSLQYNLFNENDVPVFLVPFIRLLTNGQLGVTIFFVLSGFLINSLLLKEEDQFGSISWKHFFVRRLLRIVPAYAVLLLFYGVLSATGKIDISPASWATSLTYTKYINWSADWYTGHFWSLSIEEQYYLLWPLLFMTGHVIRKRIALLIVLIVPIFRIIGFYYPAEWFGDFSIFQRIDAIAIGSLIAFNFNSVKSMIKKHPRLLFWTSLAVLILLHYLSEWVAMFNGWWLIVPIGTSHGSIAICCISVIMVHSIVIDSGPWYYFLNLRWIAAIGTVSYGIYLWQQFFVYHSNHWWHELPVNLLLLTLIVIVSWYAIEKPMIRLKERFTK